MTKLSSLVLAVGLSASVALGAIDFFGLPDKIVIPKSVAATPPPVPVPTPPQVPISRPPSNSGPTDVNDPPIRPASPDDNQNPSPNKTLQVFASASDQYTLYVNGREILTGADSYSVQSGFFPIIKGDVISAVVEDTSGKPPSIALRIVREGRTILDASDLRYATLETPSWKVSRLIREFRLPKIKSIYRQMGNESRVKSAAASPAIEKDTEASTLYFKAIVP